MSPHRTVSSTLLPRKGETVLLNGLVGSHDKFNGQRATTVSFDASQGRYSLRLLEEQARGDEALLDVKLDNIVCSHRKVPLHVFIPCHIATDRRVEAFRQTVKSVLNQVAHSYSVHVGLSGPAKYRKIASDSIASMTIVQPTPSPVQWYIQDDQVEARSQLEHIYRLLQDSLLLHPQALVMFVDNDDMCHPQRFYQFLNFYKMASLPTLAIPCKLLLSDKVSSKEGQYENIVDVEDPNDFGHWKRNRKLRRNVTIATNSWVNELDAEEYFDFIVPSMVLQKFFALTPEPVREHRFCDLRLYAYLDKLSPVELDDNPAVPWLLAHYKISEHDKKRAFDRHGVLAGGPQSVDQASYSIMKPSHGDVALSQRFQTRNILSPNQVALCRAHLESIVIQFYGWSNDMLRQSRRDKIAELNQLYGRGFGEALWGECENRIASLFGTRHLSQYSSTTMLIALAFALIGYYVVVHSKTETMEEPIGEL